MNRFIGAESPRLSRRRYMADVAVVHSPWSEIASLTVCNPVMARFVDEYCGWCDFLGRTHRQWDVVLQQDLTAGNLNRFPVVVLPSVTVLSDADLAEPAVMSPRAAGWWPPAPAARAMVPSGTCAAGNESCAARGPDDERRAGRALLAERSGFGRGGPHGRIARLARPGAARGNRRTANRGREPEPRHAAGRGSVDARSERLRHRRGDRQSPAGSGVFDDPPSARRVARLRRSDELCHPGSGRPGGPCSTRGQRRDSRPPAANPAAANAVLQHLPIVFIRRLGRDSQ